MQLFSYCQQNRAAISVRRKDALFDLHETLHAAGVKAHIPDDMSDFLASGRHKDPAVLAATTQPAVAPLETHHIE